MIPFYQFNMKENITYEIKCRMGMNKLNCPYISKMEHCCECSNAFYIPREPISDSSPVEEAKTNTEQKQND